MNRLLCLLRGHRLVTWFIVWDDNANSHTLWRCDRCGTLAE